MGYRTRRGAKFSDTTVDRRAEAQDLTRRWDDLEFEEKRKIVENVVERITVGDNQIEIELAYLPTVEPPPLPPATPPNGEGDSSSPPKTAGKRQRRSRGSWCRQAGSMSTNNSQWTWNVPRVPRVLTFYLSTLMEAHLPRTVDVLPNRAPQGYAGILPARRFRSIGHQNQIIT